MNDRLKRAGSDVPVVVGGTIPEQDIPVLQQLGVCGVFLPNTPLEEVVQQVTDIIEKSQQQEAVV